MRKSLVALMAVALVGCSGPVDDDRAVPEPVPSETESSIPLDPTTEAVDPGGDEDDWRTLRPETIDPDPDLVASMECQDPSSAVLEWGAETTSASNTEFIDAAMVEVGEGNNAGEIWWVVAARYQAGEVVRLTNQPSLPDSERGTWIFSRQDSQGRRMWHHVDWDKEQFITLQSAVAKAVDCLDLA